MNWLDPQRYSLPVVVSVVLHLAVAALFLWHWPTEHKVPEPVPQHVIANIVQEENQAVKQRQEKAEQERKRKALAEKRAAERKKQQLAEKKRQQQQAQKQLAEQKKRQQEKVLQEKKLAEQQAREKAAQEKAAKEKAEQQARERAEQEKALQQQLAREQAEAERRAEQEAIKRAEQAAAMKADAVTQIKNKVQSVWRYPPAVRPDQEVGVHITLVPTGEVIDVRIIQSSGNAALDRSVEQAIRKASPLPVPQDPRVFEQSFRNFTIKFRPENATW
ncbi:MAG: cell envelope integrity protein TolA [Pseudomonadota bacterium]|nr:cell envelope integrity protein TolA [Pseudomonadota bacterium]